MKPWTEECQMAKDLRNIARETAVTSRIRPDQACAWKAAEMIERLVRERDAARASKKIVVNNMVASSA